MKLPIRLGESRDLLPVLAGRPRHELEFLPAALEIIDTPAPPAARLIPATICAFCAAAIGWSIIGRIDIVANAPGTVIPLGKVKTVQPLQAGVVEQILVADGTHVEAGQPVIRLDAVGNTANRDKIAADLARARLDVAGLTALRDEMLQRPGRHVAFRAPRGASPEAVAQEYATSTARWAEQQAKLAALGQQIAEKRVEAVENAANIDKLRASLPMLAGIRDMYRKLYAMQLGSRVDLLSNEEKYSGAAHDLAIQIEHGGEATANQAALARQFQAQQADYASGVLKDLSDAEQKIAEDEAQYRAAVHDMAATVLRAPVSGTVQQLAVHSARAVVTPAQKLMVVVPDDHRLVVEAMVANRDIGFVSVGQAVKVKVAAFSFTRYGLIPGHIAEISRDSVDDTPKDTQDQAQGVSGNGKDASSQSGGEPDLDGGQGSGYLARIALDRGTIPVGGHLARLGPGMSVTAEILTGRRRVISYLLSPVSRYLQDAGKER